VAREYGLDDIDGRRPDWGTLGIDYSQVPQPMMEALKDGLEVQIGWLERLLERTRSFRARLLKSL